MSGARASEKASPPLPSFPAASALHRFKESVQTLGHVDSLGRVHCVSPLLYETGRIPFTLSMDNGRSFPRSGTWLAGEPHLAGPGPGTPMGTSSSVNLCAPGPPTGSCRSG